MASCFGVAVEPLQWRATSAFANFATTVLQLAAFAVRNRAILLRAESAAMGQGADQDQDHATGLAAQKHCGGGGDDGGEGSESDGDDSGTGTYGYEDALMVGGALLGLSLGNRLARLPAFSSGAAMQKGILVFLVLGAASMLSSGLDDPVAELAVSAIAAGACGAFLAYQDCLERVLQREKVHEGREATGWNQEQRLLQLQQREEGMGNREAPKWSVPMGVGDEV